MKLEEILKLDCKEKENRKLLLEKLLELKPFEGMDAKDITFEIVEKKYKQLCEKSYIRISTIMPSTVAEYYTAFLKDWKNDKNLPLCYGINMKEVYIKVFIYSYIRTKKDPNLRREIK